MPWGEAHLIGVGMNPVEVDPALAAADQRLKRKQSWYCLGYK
jgi:hypothetical protein